MAGMSNGNSETIEEAHVRSAVAVALKLARFRPSRLTLESDAICSAAADAVMESFKRAGWRVVHALEYPGWGTDGTVSRAPLQPPKRPAKE
jgi:hypothetical protein